MKHEIFQRSGPSGSNIHRTTVVYNIIDYIPLFFNPPIRRGNSELVLTSKHQKLLFKSSSAKQGRADYNAFTSCMSQMAIITIKVIPHLNSLRNLILTLYIMDQFMFIFNIYLMAIITT